MAVSRPAPSLRINGVLNSVISELGNLVQQRPGTLSLAQGMVSWCPPPAVETAVREVMAEGPPSLHRYGNVAGDAELLAAVAHTLGHHHGLELDHSSLLITAGSNMAFSAIVQVLCDGPTAEPTEVILPLPYYFNHVMAIQLAGGWPKVVDAGLIPDPDRLAAAITSRTRAIVTVSPNNPSGVVVPPAVLAAINALCEARGLLHICDEAYALFSHGAQPAWSPGSTPGSSRHTVTLQTLSKAYGMAGWRVGYMAAPRDFADALVKVQDTVLICPPRLVQRAALAALEAGPDWCLPQIAKLAERRMQLLGRVAEQQRLGLPVRLIGEPDGAFYALLVVQAQGSLGERIRRGGFTSEALMRQLVLDHRVATVAGESFGFDPKVNGLVLRLSYGLLSPSELDEALSRLFDGVRAILRQRSEQ